MAGVLILRGLPGSGKSYEANKNKTERNLIVSADDFWIKGGNYKFEPTRIGEAHAQCFKRFLEALPKVSLYENIIVDNTNIRAYEIAPYILAATAFGVSHQIMTMWCDVDVALRRNTHKVPIKVILQMYAALLMESLPSFWNQTISVVDRLKEIDRDFDQQAV